jgi:hypothetical protein
MSPSGATTSRFTGPAPDDLTRAARPPMVATAVRMEALTQARTALLLTEAQIRRLRLQECRSQLLDR